jgi:hypothetical protein
MNTNTLTLSTFGGPRDPRDCSTYRARMAWITAVADLGKLAGETHTAIACVADIYAESGQHAADWGILSDVGRGRVEGQIGKFSDLMRDGVTLQSYVRVQPGPVRLTGLAKLVEPQSDHLSVFPDVKDPTWVSVFANRIEMLKSQTQQRERFEAQRSAALKLRKSWSVTEMDHRSDWPDFLPEFCREAVREFSRAWVDLPQTPAGFKAPTLPPPPSGWGKHTPRPAPVWVSSFGFR